ncbi:MAG: hypothetical protein NZ580_02840 [Bacteroidia bacterium]|nr:hypothetical protein [Bacteroidia bacterium]MDW8235722.1 hypothetical protein [Bacteroidia bacterium]
MGLRALLFLSALGLLGCGARSVLFRTPYDAQLRKQLRRQGHGWVSSGPTPTVLPSYAVIQPGQFFRLVLELRQPIPPEEGQNPQFLLVDTLRVMEDSLAYLSWYGSIKLGGLTLDSAYKVIEQAVQKVFRYAQLRLYPLYPYYIYGDVSLGRIFLDRKSIPFMEMLAVLGGQGWRQLDYSRVKVIRRYGDSLQVFMVDVRDTRVVSNLFFLQADDIIVLQNRPEVVFRTELQNIMVIFTVIQSLNLVFMIAQFLRLF